jgi:hypothetical protein
MNINLSSYKESLQDIVMKSDTNKLSKTEIEKIPNRIAQLYQQETKNSSSGLELIKAKKEALLSSIYYSHIALRYLSPNQSTQEHIHSQVMEMVTSYGGDLKDFELQYDQLVSKYNSAFLEAKKHQQELADKDKTDFKFCLVLADLLQIPLNEDERKGKFPLPTRIATGKEAIAYNKAAIRLNRNTELKRVEKYKELLRSTFVADSELLKSVPEVRRMVEKYEDRIKEDYESLSEQDLEYLKFLVKHHARNIGLNLNDLQSDEDYPVFGVSEINLDHLKWDKPYELKFLFTLNALYCDLMIATIKISHHQTQTSDFSTLSAIERLGDRLAVYFRAASPSIEDWENALAAGLCVNSTHNFLDLDHTQKIGENPWIFEFTDQSKIKPSPFYENLLSEIKTNLKELDQYFDLQKTLAACQNESQDRLLAEFHTSKPQELKNIQMELIGQQKTFRFIMDGIDITGKKYQDGIGSGKWYRFSNRITPIL